MDCAECQILIHPFVDGELDDVETLAVQTHLERARIVKASAKNSGALKRPSVAICPTRPRSQTSSANGSKSPGCGPRPANRYWRRMSTLGPLAAAAAAALFFLSVRAPPPGSIPHHPNRREHPPCGFAPGCFRCGCDSVANWFRGRLDFTIRPQVAKDAGDCIGGRLINVGDRLGALLVYQTPDGKRVRELVVPAPRATFGPKPGVKSVGARSSSNASRRLGGGLPCRTGSSTY